MSTNTQGGELTLLHGGAKCTPGSGTCDAAIAVDDTAVYAFASIDYARGALLGVPRDASGATAPTTVGVHGDMNPWPTALASDAQFVYWFGDGGVYRCKKTGCIADGAELLYGGAGEVPYMHAAGTSLVWADRKTGVVTQLDLASSPPSATRVGAVDRGVCGAMLDGDTAYYAACKWPYTVFARGPNDDQAHQLAVATDPVPPKPEYDYDTGGVFVDADAVYFLEQKRLNVVAKGGGQVRSLGWLEMLPREQKMDAEIAGTDANYVYFTYGSMPRRLPK